MASITSREKHLSTFWYSVTQINKITFNKGDYVGHLEPAIEDNAYSDLPSKLNWIFTQQIVSPPNE